MITVKSVNIQLEGMNSLEITQIEEELFEVRLVFDGKISMQYMNRQQLKQLGSTFQIESNINEIV
ncbi:hypothetical protein CD31_07870 [Lysinibacillus boronitolerans JCM 21713 = 10a = NBRC 103108]|uniref:Uncharacterized protein n=2 Tax=Lysinibacillus boronitolerans TaxID=309788 RepID=A0ABR4Y2W1_9BACI|nr:hypothetical protein CD31_07870 [Lysinibacillus boronitolerans JCM 21713 = 10a = NBRC 103108]